MVSLARGLMGDNRVFLVDEPSLGLAPKIAAGVIDALGQVELGEGAMVIAEQSIPLLSGRMDRILGMHSGQIKQDAADAFAGISVDH